VIVSNAIFSSIFTGYINKISSLKNINFIQDSTVSQKDTSRTFRIAYESLGLPSCSKVWYSIASNTSRIIAFGSSKEDCAYFYPNIPFESIYDLNNGILTFQMKMLQDGLAFVNFHIKNDIESLFKTTNVTISSIACRRPELNIENRVSDFLKPREIAKSKIFSLIGTTTLNCDSDLKNTKKWFVYRIDPVLGSSIQKINLDNNPSVYSSELFIPSNTFSYGTYKFIYQVNMLGGNSSFIEEIETFIRIIPTGISIFPFSGGMKQITIGVGQSIDLDPGKYSYDFDEIFAGYQLNYRFFCRVVIDDMPQNFPSSSYNNFVDLKQIKEGSVNVNMSINNTCFNKTS
jgi:hypothetical protein